MVSDVEFIAKEIILLKKGVIVDAAPPQQLIESMDGKVWQDSPVFKNLFYGHMILRPSCYECPYKAVMHPGDITIADYWGIEKAAPEYDDNKGVSLVLINNENGEKVFEQVRQ